MDFETVFKYTLPSVLEALGGKENGIELLKSIFEPMVEQGFVFEKADILNVSDIVFEQDQYRCYLEKFIQMTINDTRIKSYSYLLGIYNETDKFWYFIEAKELKNSFKVNKVLPNFKTKLNIPEDRITSEDI